MIASSLQSGMEAGCTEPLHENLQDTTYLLGLATAL